LRKENNNMADTSLDNAIAAAAEELKAAAPTAGKEPPAEVEETELAEETQEEETSETETSTVAELSDAQLIEARNLYKALSGPQANAIIAALAQQAGILPRQNEAPLTKKEEVVARREIKDIFAEALGKEYGFLADRLGPAIEAVVTQERETSNARFTELQQTNVEREVVASYEKLASDTKGASKQFETRMAQLSEEIPIGNMNISTYMQRLYTLASSERKSSPQKVADQIRRNAADAPSRLRSSSGPAAAAVEIPTKKMNLNEAVAWAADQVNKGKRV
jgi:hypothetical protein